MKRSKRPIIFEHAAGEPVHLLNDEPLRPVLVTEMHLYTTERRDPRTGRKVRGEWQHDVMFQYADRPQMHWIHDACQDFAKVVTSWMLTFQATGKGDVRYHAGWDRGWTWTL